MLVKLKTLGVIFSNEVMADSQPNQDLDEEEAVNNELLTITDPGGGMSDTQKSKTNRSGTARSQTLDDWIKTNNLPQRFKDPSMCRCLWLLFAHGVSSFRGAYAWTWSPQP